MFGVVRMILQMFKSSFQCEATAAQEVTIDDEEGVDKVDDVDEVWMQPSCARSM